MRNSKGAHHSQGMQLNQQIEFLSDGGDDVRDVQLYLSPEADHLLDWFHVTMRLTTLTQTAKGLPETSGGGNLALQTDVLQDLERIKWFLWHGNVFKALQVLGSVESNLEVEEYTSGNATAAKLYKVVSEFTTYIKNNKGFIPNYGERYRNGERISTGFVESTVTYVVSKRMVKKQQMRWSQRGLIYFYRFGPECSMESGRTPSASGIRVSAPSASQPWLKSLDFVPAIM